MELIKQLLARFLSLENLSKEKTSSLVKEIGFIFQNPDHQLFTNSVFDEAISH